MPFLVKAIPVDGGPEFEAVSEEECQERNMKLFVLPPNSPELNGYVERAQRALLGKQEKGGDVSLRY